MKKRDSDRITKETMACIINRLSGPRVATSALGSMFDIPNSNIALPMKATRGKVLMVYAALSALRCS
jgi:hypothetical protein